MDVTKEQFYQFLKTKVRDLTEIPGQKFLATCPVCKRRDLLIFWGESPVEIRCRYARCKLWIFGTDDFDEKIKNLKRQYSNLGRSNVVAFPVRKGKKRRTDEKEGESIKARAPQMKPCQECGVLFEVPKTGRPKVYCHPRCQKKAERSRKKQMSGK